MPVGPESPKVKHFVMNTLGHPRGFQYKNDDGDTETIWLSYGPNFLTDEELDVLKERTGFQQDEGCGWLDIYDSIDAVPDKEWHSLEDDKPTPALISYLSVEAVKMREEEAIGAKNQGTTPDGKRRALEDRTQELKNKYVG